MLYGGPYGVIDVDLHRRTSGDITLNNSGGFVAVDTNLDCTLAGARVGDWIEATLSGFIGNQAVTTVFDVATIVSAAVVSTASNGTSTPASDGSLAFYCVNAVNAAISGSVLIGPLVAGDIATDGTVKVRLLYKTNSATNRTLSASSTDPLAFGAKLIRPVFL